jgi:hypothetical protein
MRQSRRGTAQPRCRCGSGERSDGLRSIGFAWHEAACIGPPTWLWSPAQSCPPSKPGDSRERTHERSQAL